MSTSRLPTTSLSGPLKQVLDLHTAQCMKAPASPGPSGKTKQGVSVPNQRRRLYHWPLFVAHQGSADYWPLHPAPGAPPPTVHIAQITGVKMYLVHTANIALERTQTVKAKADGSGHEWASLAQYDDALVGKLEGWGRPTRNDSRHMGKRKRGSEHGDGEKLADVFGDEWWDNGKVVRTFARMGTLGESAVQSEPSGKASHISPAPSRLNRTRWEDHN